MSKKVFIDTPSPRASVEQLEAREIIHRERLSGSVGMTQKAKARKKRDVKAQACMNRDTSKRQRKLSKRRKSTIDYAPGDLVCHTKRPETPMLVMSINDSSYDNVVEVMLGGEMIRYKAIQLRKIE
jgi:hypothetical protein